MEVEATPEAPDLPQTEPVDREVTGGASLLPEKEAGSPKGQQGLNQSPGHAKEGDGGGSNLGLNLSETSTLRPLQQPGSQSGNLEEELGGEGTPPPPRAWIGETRITESTDTQTVLDEEFGQVLDNVSGLVRRLLAFKVSKEAKTESVKFMELSRIWNEICADLRELDKL